MTAPTCKTCKHWMKKRILFVALMIPSWCMEHHYPQPGDEPACEQYEEKEANDE